MLVHAGSGATAGVDVGPFQRGHTAASGAGGLSFSDGCGRTGL